MAKNKKCQTILVVDDEPSILNLCRRLLEREGFDTVTVDTAGDGLRLATTGRFDLLLTDIHLPDFTGIELLEILKKKHSVPFPVIVMTSYGSVETAVTAMKLGAADYIQKPFKAEELIHKVQEIIPEEPASETAPSAQTVPPAGVQQAGLVGTAKIMLDVMGLIKRVARSDVTVMIYGESGAGKELVARAIHRLSPRASEPFVPVDCSALASSVIESELFGHVKGAFTGAHSAREGLLREAGTGTAFLDEIVELPSEVQAKLLRVLQEKAVRPVGADKYVPIEARVVAASNRDLLEAVKNGDFREDLFYRLQIIPIHIPPLRERKDDIPLLARYFLEKHRSDLSMATDFSDDAMAALIRYDWPGNVRQLENALQQVLVLCDAEVITPDHLPDFLMDVLSASSEKSTAAAAGLMNQAEKDAVVKALRDSGGNKRQAARLLGISKTTLYAKMKKYGL